MKDGRGKVVRCTPTQVDTWSKSRDFNGFSPDLLVSRVAAYTCRVADQIPFFVRKIAQSAKKNWSKVKSLDRGKSEKMRNRP